MYKRISPKNYIKEVDKFIEVEPIYMCETLPGDVELFFCKSPNTGIISLTDAVSGASVLKYHKNMTVKHCIDVWEAYTAGYKHILYLNQDIFPNMNYGQLISNTIMSVRKQMKKNSRVSPSFEKIEED
jgi:hypothetical protein